MLPFCENEPDRRAADPSFFFFSFPDSFTEYVYAYDLYSVQKYLVNIYK